ncbi:amidohydrolase [Scopulibacillus darangshiensis]|uniref:Amidohydrolase n=1 Tax=Scopulibacillus darangshiensis TaxID=442528 RepID=A0A4R2NJ29_9BACL|nr:amidohydrolase [Scopulibacillus darangshiensis]TCP21513.1 amidohydrolase [Scopulibacillus darangshiensis]
MFISDEMAQWIIQQRRYIHQHPELSHNETNTKKYIESALQVMGLQTYSLTGKDVICDIYGRNGSRLIAARSDIDALPVQEETGLPYQSINPGVMHACGHDGHIAILLGVIKSLLPYIGKLNGSIRFIFQHAEETVPGGAKELVEKGVLKDVEAIFGYHLWQHLSAGLIGYRKGPFMAGASRFNIKIKGKGGHGSQPHETIDPTLAAAHLMTQLHTIISRDINPNEGAVISIGEMKAGSSYNVIPDTAELSGTVRYFNPDLLGLIEHRMAKISHGIEESFNTKLTLDFQKGDPPLINDGHVIDSVLKTINKLHLADNIVEVPLTFGGEDFAYYSQVIPASYIFFGTHSKDNPYLHHHPKFDIDEKMLPVGVKIMSQTLLDYLEVTS